MPKHVPSPKTCPDCDAPATGKFCARCGTDLRARPTPSVPPATSSMLSKAGPWAVAGALLLVVVFSLVQNAETSPLTDGSSAGGGAMGAPVGGGGAPPDIANMSPRERASRLYDRIVRYAAEGKQDSLQRFAPMALSSFEMLGADLDADAHYDYGRIASETGNLTLAAAQADAILSTAPDHLLGLMLAAHAAGQRNDAKASREYWKRFLQVRDAEIAKQLPEYDAHAADIAEATKVAQGIR